MVWGVAGFLFIFGSWLLGQGVWIHFKATAAQWLLHSAWEQTLKTHQPAKPWPWADTWPIGRLTIPRLGITQIILANASGPSLAFGPGRVGNGVFPDGTQSLVLSGHRDTHFSFLRNVQPGERIAVQGVAGDWHTYEVEEMVIVDTRTHTLSRDQARANLVLITCYPFDALVPGGPMRYVVTASLVSPESSSKKRGNPSKTVG